MKYRLLASDFDGTLGKNGSADVSALRAIKRWKGAGGKFAIVTGRMLEDLFVHFDAEELLDAVVAEDGAVLWRADTRTIELLGEPPPRDLLSALRKRRVPIGTGRVTLYTVRPHETAVLRAISDRKLDHHIVFNHNSIMVLPPGVNKGTGAAAAAAALGCTVGEVAGVGDAENDLALIAACGLSAAVANAVPPLKEAARLVLTRERGDGVAEFVDRILSGAAIPARR